MSQTETAKAVAAEERTELKQLVAELSLEGYRLRLLQDPDDLLPCVPLPCHQPSLSILFYRRTLLLTDTVFGGKVNRTSSPPA